MEHSGKVETRKKAAQGITFVITCAVLFFLAVLQTTWVEKIALFSGVPQLPLVFLICLSVKKEPVFSILSGMVCGMWLDLACGRQIGFDCLLYTYISAGCVWLKTHFFFRGIKISMSLVFLWTALHGIVSSVICGMVRLEDTITIALINGVYSAAVTPVFYGIFRRKEV